MDYPKKVSIDKVYVISLLCNGVGAKIYGVYTDKDKALKKILSKEYEKNKIISVDDSEYIIKYHQKMYTELYNELQSFALNTKGVHNNVVNELFLNKWNNARRNRKFHPYIKFCDDEYSYTIDELSITC
jgi:predicted component of viral defense system (DUF524 family)